MALVSALIADRIFRENDYKVVTPILVSRLFNIENRNTLYKLLQRLIAQKILERAVNGTYFVNSTNPGSFFIANSLVCPSYISLETALNYYGILPQFPYQITSVTAKRRVTIDFDSREYTFRHLAESFYFGFVKKDDFLIATPEKAVLDLLYFKSKGPVRADIGDWDLSFLDKRLLKDLAKKFNISADGLI